MPRTKRLRSVIHSIAHHSVSGVCYLHPRLGQACHAEGVSRIAVDLMCDNAASDIERGSHEIGTAAAALRRKFRDILRSESLSANDLSEAKALFHFDRGRWPSACCVRVVETSGQVSEVAVDAMGNPSEVIDNTT